MKCIGHKGNNTKSKRRKYCHFTFFLISVHTQKRPSVRRNTETGSKIGKTQYFSQATDIHSFARFCNSATKIWPCKSGTIALQYAAYWLAKVCILGCKRGVIAWQKHRFYPIKVMFSLYKRDKSRCENDDFGV